jgi:MFS family permease
MRDRRRPGHRRRLGPAFNRIWTGFTLASCGDGLSQGAVPLVAVLIDPHPFAVSAVMAADLIPWLVLALPAGHFADRFPRGQVAALANASRALSLLIGAMLLATGRMTLAYLIAVVLVNAAGRAIYYSAYQAMVPGAVPLADLEHANGVLTSTEMGAEQLAGPVAGSTLFALSESIPFFAEALAMVLSCLSFLRLRIGSQPPAQGSEDSIWGGVKLLLADQRLRVLLFLITALSLLQGMESGVLVLLATERWGIRESAYGFFLAVGAVGNIFGGLIAEGQAKRFGSARMIIGFAVLSGTGYLLMAGAHSWILAGPAYALVGVAVVAISVVGISLRQRFTPDHLMGRVGGAWRGFVWGAVPIGALAAGALATVWGLAVPLIVAGAAQIAVAVIFARPLARVITDEHFVRKAPEQRRRHAAQSQAGRSHRRRPGAAPTVPASPASGPAPTSASASASEPEPAPAVAPAPAAATIDVP